MNLYKNSDNKKEIKDKELVKLAKKGDKKAFEELIIKYQNKIFNLIFRLLGDYETALDLTQETFLKAYQNLEKFRMEAEFFTWIYRIALNLSSSEKYILKKNPKTILFTQKDKNHECKNNNINFIEYKSPEDPPDNVLLKKELQQIVQEAINKLPLKFKEIIILRDIQNLSYEEISEILKCPIGTVRSRLHRAREKLKELLKDYL